MEGSNKEEQRLEQSKQNKEWHSWGPYLAERQWGTVREDYSQYGESWDFITHDLARSNAYRWGEEGIGGFCDTRQILCIAPAFWNGKDPILKERLFGLTNGQGNHGEDVKELYFHQYSTPTHSYCRYLYKYPQKTFPYTDLVQKNQRSRDDLEFELADTEIFRDNAYFDIYIEYAKADVNDILMRITVCNRSENPAYIDVLPHVWYRNFWKHNPKHNRPKFNQVNPGHIKGYSKRNGDYHFYHLGGSALFCENETNNKRIYNTKNDTPYVKDGINNFIVDKMSTVNPDKMGSKAAIWYNDTIGGYSEKTYKIRLSKIELEQPWIDYDSIFEQRIKEGAEYYENLLPSYVNLEQKRLLENTFGGIFWTKQFYYYDVHKWLFGGPGEPKPDRKMKRNYDWQHLNNRHIISMPDKWEYPWYAAWDLAFHTTTFALADPEYAKNQLLLMLKEYFMHPNGQIPAYEWNFSDVNPPVHSWAVWHVYQKEKEKIGHGDRNFLERCFHKLSINFTWWVNQKDKDGNGLFEGGFLGLDNIGVFDRNHMPDGISRMQQADATSWMAMFALNMLQMSLELAKQNNAYEESAAKYFKHFLNIAWAMHHIGERDISLWDDEDNFYYDVVQMHSGYTARMKVRSLVGVIPLFAVDVIHEDLFNSLEEFQDRARRIIKTRPDLASLISRIEERNSDGFCLVSLLRGFRLEHILKRLLDESEFLSKFGIRSLSKYHEEHPFIFEHHGQHSISYEPGESKTSMFGGNSNWRGPIWFPINYMIIQSLRKFYKFYGPSYIYEFPTGSGIKLNLNQIAKELTLRLMKIFERDETGKYNYHNEEPQSLFRDNENFKNLHLHYEFFHGETGRGMGASHQTGWTALIANLMLELEED